ncbi:NgoPII family restriction endonuclease [Rodentibacter rarus]|uniref:NgoPII family restriction endonuclease n=1 Tax=Rodentibacter rarus TaxID=1908260 RepID=UPI0021198DF2|nr:NgoPII family restriction endonuclease [Rodentibacter rarus]
MNIINAIINLINNPITNLTEEYQGKNRANLIGKALEEYTKDLFANSFHLNDSKRDDALRHTFSWLGNANNPPDAMLKNGDAIEVKKIENDNATIALNSSHPKHKLYANSTLISRGCREAEEWSEKDIIYLVGVVKNNILKHLCFVYGEDYCADDEIYTRVKTLIKKKC